MMMTMTSWSTRNTPTLTDRDLLCIGKMRKTDNLRLTGKERATSLSRTGQSCGAKQMNVRAVRVQRRTRGNSCVVQARVDIVSPLGFNQFSKNFHPQIQVNKNPFADSGTPRRYSGCCSTCLPGGQQLPSIRSVHTPNRRMRVRSSRTVREQAEHRAKVLRVDLRNQRKLERRTREELRVRAARQSPSVLMKSFAGARH